MPGKLLHKRSTGILGVRRVHWNTWNVDWNSFIAAVEEATELFSAASMSLSDMIHRFNSALLAAAKLHVGKSKAGRYTKPWSTAEHLEAIKKRTALRRTVADNRAEYLEACGTTRKLSEEALQKKWEEFLADLENNPDPARTWRAIKALSGTPSSTTFAEPLLHKG